MVRAAFCVEADSLYRWLLPHLSAEHVEAALADWVWVTLQAQPDDPIALDGKAVRGAGCTDQAAPHLLVCCTHYSQETLFQVRVECKPNKIPIAQALLAVVLLHGCVCTADALHTHLAFVQAVRALHGHVVLVVKDNQPTFHADLVTYFTDPLARFEQAETVDYQRGCKECRHIKVTTALNAYLSASWPHVAQVAQLTRTVTTARKTSQQVVYLLTTLPPDAGQFQRAYWNWCGGIWALKIAYSMSGM